MTDKSQVSNRAQEHRANHKLLTPLVACLATIHIATGAARAQPQIFVDAGASGAKDGSSWTDAYNSLQDGDGNGVANFTDIFLTVLGFQGDFSGASANCLDIHPCIPDGAVNFADIFQVVVAFQGDAYSAICPLPCP